VNPSSVNRHKVKRSMRHTPNRTRIPEGWDPNSLALAASPSTAYSASVPVSRSRSPSSTVLTLPVVEAFVPLRDSADPAASLLPPDALEDAYSALENGKAGTAAVPILPRVP
jgi:hypothetical protein